MRKIVARSETRAMAVWGSDIAATRPVYGFTSPADCCDDRTKEFTFDGCFHSTQCGTQLASPRGARHILSSA
ncbi:hypothetical protein GCM10011415_20530 [Salipiger pallidus]|uniref:Uncharacterized protein n=1 Tax=Salipiger pallidus TaxID=1775170 RepID=A0A8J3EGQ0_9RHOB|nr:hypothetical protein GCM10011415_20530 [Salipiger pallidus]